MLKDSKNLNLPELEEKVLAFWKENGIFEKTLAQRKGKKTFNFYEGPPYANGRPGIHHVLARVFKDIILRYKTMQGFYVSRKAGWDTHGLPVELEAEKQLGIKNKQEIEKFGIALFNQKAREAVWKYKDEWERMTERIGYWLDLKNAYVTYKPDYIESCWWIFKEVSKRGYLAKNYKIVPYCPRCQTPLASHELGFPGVYKKVSDPSVFVKLKLKDSPSGKKSSNEYLLVWTTTPWTLPANVGVAVDPKLTYTKFSVSFNGRKEYFWSYNTPPELPGHKIEVAEKLSGKKLLGLRYESLYKADNPEFKPDKFFKVLGGDFVSTEDGTGLVHIAPAFGEDDLNLIKSVDKDFNWQSVPMTVDDAGRVLKGFPGAGKFVKDADADILQDLKQRGLLYHDAKIEHEYPFCWRCGTPLLYFARLSWFFEMSRLRDQLVAGNKGINWIPEYLKEGRFGEWIKEARDWSLSRDRFWGTPLPVWECEKCGDHAVVGDFKELDDKKYFNNKFLLLRHTEAEHNVKKVCASGPEKGNHISNLTKKGLKDAGAVARKLKAKKISVIYTSPYKRAKTMAALISKTTGAKVVEDARLSEINCGVYSWRLDKDYKKFFSNPLERFTKAPVQGETLADLKKRVWSFTQEVNERHNHENILVVSHGDPLWMLEAAMKHLSNEQAFKLPYLRPGVVHIVEMSNIPADDLAEIDIHRPFVDRVYLKCDSCGGKMKRVKDVADVWFDSGAMPYASYHFPFSFERDSASGGKNRAKSGGKTVPAGFPADYICEALDQTRGWFYTLLAVSTLLGNSAPYKNVVSLGLILDKHGVKMSKSKGNIVDPWNAIANFGVDAIRWYLFTVNPPGEPKLFDEAEVTKTMRRFLMIIFNSYVFFETYGKKGLKNGLNSKNQLDAWILSRLAQVEKEVTENLDKYYIVEAAKSLEPLIDDLSRWYIRRSRRRFQKPVSRADFEAASATLEYVLTELSRLIAPFTPFFAEALYWSLTGKKEKLSVHLTDWPKAGKFDQKLIEAMAFIRDLSTKGLAKRAEAGIKVRQPLLSLSVKTPVKNIPGSLLDILKDEINVKEIKFVPNLPEECSLDTRITEELREEGLMRELTRIIQELRQKAGYKPKDRIELYIESEPFCDIFGRNSAALKNEVGAKSVFFKRTDKFDAEIITKIEDAEFWAGVRRI